ATPATASTIAPAVWPLARFCRLTSQTSAGRLLSIARISCQYFLRSGIQALAAQHAPDLPGRFLARVRAHFRMDLLDLNRAFLPPSAEFGCHRPLQFF